jgi:hypothetical protein
MMTNRGRLPMLLTRNCPFVPLEVGSFPLSRPLFLYDAVDPIHASCTSSSCDIRQSAPLPPSLKEEKSERLLGALLPVFYVLYSQWFPPFDI